MKKASNRFMKKRPLQFGDYSTRELWVASFAGVRGAITRRCAVDTAVAE